LHPGIGASFRLRATNRTTSRFIAWVSKDGQTWGKPAGEGEFANIAANRSIQAVRFDAPVSGRYLHLVLPRAIQDKPIIGLAGIGILTR
jgi:alpha-L-fucosidase